MRQMFACIFVFLTLLFHCARSDDYPKCREFSQELFPVNASCSPETSCFDNGWGTCACKMPYVGSHCAVHACQTAYYSIGNKELGLGITLEKKRLSHEGIIHQYNIPTLVEIEDISNGRYAQHVHLTLSPNGHGFIGSVDKLFAFGAENYGALGLGFNDTYIDYPVEVVLPVVEHLNHHLYKIWHVSAGYEYSLITTNVGVFGMGLNDQGQLGVQMDTPWCNTPRFLLINDTIIEAHASFTHSIFVTNSSRLFFSGDHALDGDVNSVENQLNAKLMDLEILTSVWKVALGKSFSVVLRSDSSLISWGKDATLGSYLSSPEPILIPFDVDNDRRIVDIAAGNDHVVLVTNLGEVLGFGRNHFGCLGELSSITSIPTVMFSIDDFEGFLIHKISAGPAQTLFIDDHYGVFAIGRGNRKEFGDVGTTSIPKRIIIPKGGITTVYGAAVTEGSTMLLSGKIGNMKCKCIDFTKTGDNCDMTSCFAKREDDNDVCSGHGKCIDYDSCVCEHGWGGFDCSYPSCHYEWHAACGGESVGTCIAPETCDCNPGYFGSFCQFDDCSNDGFWTNDCSKCANGFAGEDCDIFMGLGDSFFFSNDGKSLFMSYSAPDQDIGCSLISSNFPKFGSGANCRIENETLYITLGSDHTLHVQDQVQVISTLDSTWKIDVTVRDSMNPILPKAVLLISNPIISRCTTLLLDGTDSISPDGFPLKYTFRIRSSTCEVEELTAFLRSRNDLPYALIPEEFVANYTGCRMTIRLEVETKSGRSHFAEQKVIFSVQTIPQIFIEGFPMRAVVQGQESILRTSLIPCSNFDVHGMQYRWFQTGGPSELQVSPLQNPEIKIPALPYSPPGEIPYEFAVVARSNDIRALQSYQEVQVRVVSRNIVATIKGGIVQRFSTNSFVLLDGSNSHDPLNSTTVLDFAWSCSNYFDNSPCIGFGSNGPMAHVQQNSYNAVTVLYVRLVVIALDGRRSTAVKIVELVPEVRTFVEIESLPAEILSHEYLRLSGKIHSSEEYTFEWTEVNGQLKFNDDLIFSSQDGGLTLVLFPVLEPGKSYTFQLSAKTQDGSEGFARETTTVKLNPRAGQVYIDPPDGGDILTKFDLSTANWLDDTLDFTWYYVDWKTGVDRLIYGPTYAKVKPNIFLPNGNPSDDYILKIKLVARNYVDRTQTIVTKLIRVVPKFDIDDDKIVDVVNEIDPNGLDPLTEILHAVNLLNSPPIREKIEFKDLCAKCSFRGSCKHGICDCVVGYFGADCSIYEPEERTRQKLRTVLFDKMMLVSVINTCFRFTQRLNIASGLAYRKNEITPNLMRHVGTFVIDLLDIHELCDYEQMLLGTMTYSNVFSSLAFLDKERELLDGDKVTGSVNRNVEQFLKLYSDQWMNLERKKGVFHYISSPELSIAVYRHNATSFGSILSPHQDSQEFQKPATLIENLQEALPVMLSSSSPSELFTFTFCQYSNDIFSFLTNGTKVSSLVVSPILSHPIAGKFSIEMIPVGNFSDQLSYACESWNWRLFQWSSSDDCEFILNEGKGVCKCSKFTQMGFLAVVPLQTMKPIKHGTSDLTWLWIVLGVTGGIAVLCCLCLFLLLVLIAIITSGVFGFVKSRRYQKMVNRVYDESLYFDSIEGGTDEDETHKSLEEEPMRMFTNVRKVPLHPSMYGIQPTGVSKKNYSDDR